MIGILCCLPLLITLLKVVPRGLMLISPLFHPAHPVEQIRVFTVILVQPRSDTRSAEEQHPQLKELLQTVHTGLMRSGGTKHFRGVLAIFIHDWR